MIQRLKILLIFLLISSISIHAQVRMGAEQMEKLLPLLNGKRIALVVNHTSVVGQTQTHLLDTLLSLKVDIRKVFAP